MIAETKPAVFARLTEDLKVLGPDWFSEICELLATIAKDESHKIETYRVDAEQKGFGRRLGTASKAIRKEAKRLRRTY